MSCVSKVAIVWAGRLEKIRKGVKTKVFMYVCRLRLDEDVYDKETFLFTWLTCGDPPAFGSDIYSGVPQNERLCVGTYCSKYKEYQPCTETL